VTDSRSASDHYRTRLQARSGLLYADITNGLHGLARPLRFELESLCLPSSELGQIWSATSWKPIDYAMAILDDVDCKVSLQRNALEDALADLVFLCSAAVLLQDGLLSAETGFSYSHSLLLPNIHARIAFKWLAFTHNDVWASEMFYQAWTKSITDLQHLGSGNDIRGGKWAPVALPTLAALVIAKGKGDVPTLLSLLDESCRIFAVSQELHNLNRDLARGVRTAVIQHLARDCGMDPANLAMPLDPNQIILGAMLLPTLTNLSHQTIQDVARLVTRTRQAGFPALGQCFEMLAQPFTELLSLLAGSKPLETTPTICISPMPQKVQALRAAHAYLDSETAAYELREEYRWGFLGAELLTGRTYTAGLILEQRILAGGKHYHPAAAELIAHYESNNFHYFEEPNSLPPDSDTLGLMLRLSALTGIPVSPAYQRFIQRVIEQSHDGFPVYILDDPGCHNHLRSMTGLRCTAVHAGFLAGLALINGSDADVEHLAHSLLHSLANESVAGWVNYDLPYGLLMLTTCLKALRKRATHSQLLENLESTIHTLATPLWGRSKHSPQDAALLMLAQVLPPTLQSEALNCILRHQRPDGSWHAESLFMAPNRGARMTPFSSRTVTTSFCLHALTLSNPEHSPSHEAF
jgi:hypothetical protein